MHCPRWNNDFYISNARIQYGLLNWKRVSVTHTLFASFCRFVHTFFFGFLKFISCSVSRLAPLAIRSSLWTVSDHRIAYVCAVCARARATWRCKCRANITTSTMFRHCVCCCMPCSHDCDGYDIINNQSFEMTYRPHRVSWKLMLTTYTMWADSTKLPALLFLSIIKFFNFKYINCRALYHNVELTNEAIGGSQQFIANTNTFWWNWISYFN